MRFPITLAEAQQRLTELKILADAHPVAAGATALAVLFHTFVWCRVLWKAGYAPALGLLAIVPPMALIFPFALGLLRTPADREMATLRGIEQLMRRNDSTAFRRRAS